MANYTKTTDFLIKDTAPTGSSSKVVRGSEFDVEFNNLQTVSATKADLIDPTFSGTVTTSNLTVLGNTALGNSSTDTVTVFTDLLPSADGTHDLGASGAKWQDLHINGTATLANINNTGSLLVTGTATMDSLTVAQPSAGTGAFAAGFNAGVTNQGQYATAVGTDAGNDTQGDYSVAIGNEAGQTNQGDYSTAVGHEAGQTNQGDYSTAVGWAAGETDQGDQSVAVGYSAGFSNQGDDAIAVGENAGRSNQGNKTVAVGGDAGNSSQGFAAVAVGRSAGRTAQGVSAVAIGDNAGNDTQGDYSVAIGRNAGNATQGANGVIISSSGLALNDTSTGHIHIKSSGSSLDYTTAAGWSFASGDVAFAGNISLGDNDKLKFGGGSDLQIYHSGTNSYIQDTGTGSLYVHGSSNILMGSTTQTNLIIADGGAVTARYNGVNTLATTATGINVTGSATMDGITVTGTLGNWSIDPNGSIQTFTRASANYIRAASAGGYLSFQTGGTNERLKVNDDGINVTGELRSAQSTAGLNAFSAGYLAGVTTQGVSAVAIGQLAGNATQGDYATAVGRSAGHTSQGLVATAVGYFAGGESQGVDATAVGREAGLNNQGTSAVAVGSYAGKGSATVGDFQGDNAVAVGTSAGATTQGANSVAVGRSAGQNTQGANSVAVGREAGAVTQGASSTALGYRAGQTSQSDSAVAVGTFAGNATQGALATAVGPSAGQTTQGANAVAIGYKAGNTTQGAQGVAVGFFAGEVGQSTDAIAIGNSAGEDNQGVRSIAIGAKAGETSQANYGIILGTTGAALNDTSEGHIHLQTTQGELKFTSAGGWEMIDGGVTNLKVPAAGGLEVNGTATMDGLTVENVSNTLLRVSDSTHPNQRVDLQQNAGVTSFISGNNGAYGTIEIQAYNGTSTVDRLKILASGDVEFYDAAGTTATMVWDASAESLGIGNTSPSATYGIDSTKPMRVAGAAPSYSLQETDASNQLWLMGSYSGTYAIRDISGGTYPFRIEAGAPTDSLRLNTTGVDITGTATMDGIVINRSGVQSKGIEWNRTGTIDAAIKLHDDEVVRFDNFYNLGYQFRTGASGSEKLRLDLSSNGDVGFYNAGGTSPKMQWTASSQSLQIGDVTSLSNNLVSVDAGGTSPTDLIASNNYAAVFGSTTTSAAGVTQGIMLSGGASNIRGVALLAEVQSTGNNTDFIIATSNAGAKPTEKMRVTDTGNVGIGTSIPTYPLVVSSSNDEGIEFNPAASAGVNNTLHYDRTGAVYVTNRTLASKHEWRIGGSTEAMRIDTNADVVISGGVYLGGIAAANKLDDYEEGTWTPTVIGATSGSATITSMSQNTYTKIGNVVTANVYIGSVTMSGLVGDIQIGGLPFTSNGFHAITPLSNGNIFTFDMADFSVGGFTQISTNRIQLRRGSSRTTITGSDITGDARGFMLNITYKTDS